MKTLSSGSEALDVALGGGYPCGRLVEVYGPKSSGKRELALHAIVQAQAAGGVVAYVDAEHAFDAECAQSVGIDMERLLVSQPDSERGRLRSTAGEALDVVEMLARSGAVDLIVVASVAALTPDVVGDLATSQVAGWPWSNTALGLQARLLSQAMRTLTATAHRTGAAVLLVNDTPTMPMLSAEPGGNAVRFYASIRMNVTRVDGATKVRIVKNKLAMPFQEAEIRWEDLDT